ncbi:MAG: hypothetical protein EAZ28_05645 [Oscillatoriales cyanobacterium]|nr:MAG: hypothetical protein EAZ28_05645 [Oscillatoriales cyanobacterium]
MRVWFSANYNFAEYLLTYINLCTIGEQDLNEPQSMQSTQRARREGRERVGIAKIWCLTNVPIAIVY